MPTPDRAAEQAQYWLVSFTPETWAEFLEAGASQLGFPDSARNLTAGIRERDLFLCYIVGGAKRFVGIAEATGEPFDSEERIWRSGEYPIRVPVDVAVRLDLERGVPISELLDELPSRRGRESPTWTYLVLRSPTKWDPRDGEVVVDALLRQEQLGTTAAAAPLTKQALLYRPRHAWADTSAVDLRYLISMVDEPGGDLPAAEIARRLVARGLLDEASTELTRKVRRAVDEGRVEVATLPQAAAADLGTRALVEALAAHRRAVKAHLLERLLALPPDEFEVLTARLLEAMGVEDVEVTGRTGDGGMDVIGELRSVGSLLQPIRVQSKRYKRGNTVGPAVVRELRGVLRDGWVGMVVTTSTFTRAAREEAQDRSLRPVALIDGELLTEKLIEHEIGIRKKGTAMLEPVDFLLDG